MRRNRTLWLPVFIVLATLACGVPSQVSPSPTASPADEPAASFQQQEDEPTERAAPQQEDEPAEPAAPQNETEADKLPSPTEPVQDVSQPVAPPPTASASDTPEQPAPAAPPAPTANVPAPTAAAVEPTAPPPTAPDGAPELMGAAAPAKPAGFAVYPSSGPIGTTFGFNIKGLEPYETVLIIFSLSSGGAEVLSFTVTADSQGQTSAGIITEPGDPTGLYVARIQRLYPECQQFPNPDWCFQVGYFSVCPEGVQSC